MSTANIAVRLWWLKCCANLRGGVGGVVSSMRCGPRKPLHERSLIVPRWSLAQSSWSPLSALNALLSFRQATIMAMAMGRQICVKVCAQACSPSQWSQRRRCMGWVPARPVRQSNAPHCAHTSSCHRSADRRAIARRVQCAEWQQSPTVQSTRASHRLCDPHTHPCRAGARQARTAMTAHSDTHCWRCTRRFMHTPRSAMWARKN